MVRIDNKPEVQQDSLLGRYTIRTFWSENGRQLISAVSLHAKESRDAHVTIFRERRRRNAQGAPLFTELRESGLQPCGGDPNNPAEGTIHIQY
jgi:hypothetical protein